ncbi:cold-shock protein [Streptomyces sp. NPDC002676]
MSEATSEDVFDGRVLEWRREEGWGVLASDALPDGVWAHFSAIQAEGFRELTAGQSVRFSAEQAEQDGYRWRAVSVWPEGAAHPRQSGDDGPAYSSSLHITFDS